jgi:serine/threonine-protein kinase
MQTRLPGERGRFLAATMPPVMRLGSYEILQEIGRGGAAIVYRARGADGRDVALKLLHQTETDDLKRFLREQRVHASLGAREGFVPLVDTGTAPDGPYLVMPYLRGGTLRDQMEDGALEIAQVVGYGRTIATSLGIAHERGIVHRDLKPENILFSSDGRPFITDLGLAKHFGGKAAQKEVITMDGEACGTVGFMAPEQVGAGKATVGPPADVFALGAILYECLAGRPAISEVTVEAMLETLATRGIEPLRQIRPDTPEALSRVIERSLAREAGSRWADGNTLARALGARLPEQTS